MELYERIRRDHVEQGWGIRRLAKEHRCHRREVRQALTSATPPAAVGLTRARPVLGPWIATIDAMLAEDRKAPRKQRHTAHRIYGRLVSEFGAKIGEPTVRAWVRERRRELYGTVEAMVPQVHDAGEEAEVDLSEADVDFDWGRETVTFFQMRVPQRGGVPRAVAVRDAAGVSGGPRRRLRAFWRGLPKAEVRQPVVGGAQGSARADTAGERDVHAAALALPFHG